MNMVFHFQEVPVFPVCIKGTQYESVYLEFLLGWGMGRCGDRTG